MCNKDLLSIKDLTKEQIENILERAESFKQFSHLERNTSLAGKIVANLFFEASTRTRSSFEIAAKRLSAGVINFYPETSSISKGESVVSTAKVFEALGANLLIVRHDLSGMPKKIAKVVDIPVINAGDSTNEHPSQVLLDLFTVWQQKNRIEGLKLAIIGDITYSRVARSDIYGFSKMGAEVRVAGPPTMLPGNIESLGVKAYTSLRGALEGADVVMALRIQFERHGVRAIDTSDYVVNFGLTAENLKLAKKDVILMHPGPVNWGIELNSDLQKHPSNVILEQVRNGIFVRMAILSSILGN